jgi:cytochrome c oxidase cbb3-type subunit 3
VDGAKTHRNSEQNWKSDMMWMTRSSAAILLLVVSLYPAQSVLIYGQTTQDTQVANPVAGDPAAIREGASLFRANCSPCHGLNAKGGGRGPDLTSARWTHGSSDAEIFRTISQGVTGTQMPPNAFEDSEIWTIIAYLRSLAPSDHAKTTGGDPVRGEKLFTGSAGCAACHMVKGHGGLLGPDLTRVGASRSATYLIESIRDPDKELSDGMLDPNNHYGLPLVYDTVTVVLKDGQKVTGIAKNEDTFSVQLMDTDQRLRFFLKSDVKDVVHKRKSLMPAYTDQTISAAELQDLLAYLERLRGE